MHIFYYEERKTFQINTKNTTYAFCITNLDFIEHLYYGKRIDGGDFTLLSNRQVYTFASTIYMTILRLQQDCTYTKKI